MRNIQVIGGAEGQDIASIEDIYPASRDEGSVNPGGSALR